MSIVRRSAITALATTAAFTVPAAASAAPADRTPPVLGAFKVTPVRVCPHPNDGWYEPRKITFKLSEPARLRLHVFDMWLGVLPVKYQVKGTANRELVPAGPGIAWSSLQEPDTAAVRFNFPSDPVQPYAYGSWGLEAVDAAGNRSSIHWINNLVTGYGASSRGEASANCR